MHEMDTGKMGTLGQGLCRHVGALDRSRLNAGFFLAGGHVGLNFT